MARSASVSRSRSRARSRSNSHSPRHSPQLRSSSPNRSLRGSVSREDLDRRNGNRRTTSRSPSRDRSRSLVRGGSRDRSLSRSRSRSKSPIHSAKIVVEKLTKNVNEGHLREIFGSYVNTNRGTAYILYRSTSDAEAAISHMHEAQIDGAVISVSIVLPRRRFSPSPPLRRGTEPSRFERPSGPPSYGRPPPRYSGRYPSPPGRGPPRGRSRSPPRGFGRGRGDGWQRRRSYSRSRSPPRRHRSRSYSSSPPRHSQPSRRGPGPSSRGGRRSPSYDSYSDYSSRSRSRSRERAGDRRR